MPNTSPAWLLKKLLVALTLLLSACGAAPVSSPPIPVAPPRIPALPQAARQPKPPVICLQTCSNGLTTERVSLRDMPIKLGLPASSASAPTTR